MPTIESFAAWKTAAWQDRAAARDLYDLWALAEARLITRDAADLFANYGPTGTKPRQYMFATAPSDAEWQASLSGQTRLKVNASDALADVRSAWASAVDEAWD